ncbi:MAG: restriction endonuclease subunit S [Bacteroidota bacterium]
MSTDIKLPKDWELKTLGDVCHTTSGGTPSRGNKNYYHGNIPWVKSGELDRGLILDTEEKITEEAIKNSSAKVFPKGTLLIALYGATIGKLAFLGVDAATNQAICGIYQNENIDSKFLYNYLFHKKRDLVGQGIGGAQPNISQTILKQLEIPLPPLSTQQAIVSKIEELFSELDNGIANLKTAQQQLKTYRQSVLKWAFEGRFTSHSPRGEGWGEVKDGELPMGWIKLPINQIAEINPKLPNKDNISKQLEVQFLPMKLVEEIINKIHLTEIRKFEEVLKGSYTPFINGDVIFAKVTPCMENGKIAKVENLRNGIGFGSSEFHVIRAKEKVLGSYIFNFLVQDRFRNEAANEMTGAVGLRRVPKQFIENYIIPLPPIAEQEKIILEIESRLSVADKMEESITQSLQQAEALRQSILKKAFSGELLPSSPTLLLAEKGALNAQPVLSPSPSRRGTKGEVNVHKVESKKPNAKF